MEILEEFQKHWQAGRYPLITSLPVLKALLQRYDEFSQVYQDLVLSEPLNPQRDYFFRHVVKMRNRIESMGLGICECKQIGFRDGLYGNSYDYCLCMDHAPLYAELVWQGSQWQWVETGKCPSCGDYMERDTCDMGYAVSHGYWSCRCGYDQKEHVLPGFFLQVLDQSGKQAG